MLAFTKRGAAGAPVCRSLETQIAPGTYEIRASGEVDFQHEIGNTINQINTAERACCRRPRPGSLKIGNERFPYHRIDPFLSNGYLGMYNASVRGGGENLQYFTSAKFEFEGGTGILPQDSIATWTVRNNFTFTPAEGLQLQWNTGYANTVQRNTPVGGNANGLTHNAYRGYANYFNSEDPDVLAAALFTQKYKQQIERFTTGGTVTYSPMANMTHRMTVGYDNSQQEIRGERPFGFSRFARGSIYNDTWQNRLLTLDYVGTYNFGVVGDVRSSFSWGGQAIGEEELRLNGYGETLPPGAEPTVSSAATLIAYEDRSKIWNAGFFFQNVFDISNRYFITVGTRVDGNSAFGRDFGLQVYPKASASWVMSDEDFWNADWGSLKLRAAYGQSGRAPAAFDAVRTWDPVGWDGETSLLPLNVGSPDIGPEVTAEFETGFDGSFWDDRVSATFTYYRQTTSDALFNVAQIPSNGFSGQQRQNIGELVSSGIELSLDGSPIRGADWGWDVGIDITTNHSEVTDIGGIPAFAVDGDVWVMEGQPAPVLRGRYVSNPDAIEDPVFVNNFVHGPTYPTLIWSPRTSIRAPGGITLSANGEFRGGHYTQERNFTSGGVGRGAWMPVCWDYYVNPYDGPTNNYARPGPEFTRALKPDTPALWRAICTPSTTRDSLTARKSDFFRLRNVSAQIPVNAVFPERISNAVLTVTVSNYWSWFNDQWVIGDPEQGFAEDYTFGPESLPPPTWNLNASLRVTF